MYFSVTLGFFFYHISLLDNRYIFKYMMSFQKRLNYLFTYYMRACTAKGSLGLEQERKLFFLLPYSGCVLVSFYFVLARRIHVTRRRIEKKDNENI